MLMLANLLLLLAGVALLLVVVPARPTRGENMMGFHLVVIPIALGMTLALALGIAVAWPAEPVSGWWLGLALPGHLVGLVVLIFACYDRRGAHLAKLAALATGLGAAATIDGHMIAPTVQFVGGGIVAAVGAITYGSLLWWGVVPRLRRFVARRASSGQLDDFQLGLAQQDRERWQRVGADASLEQLLAYTRSYAADVKEQSIARIAAWPELDTAMAVLLRSKGAEHALFFITHQYPHNRAGLGAAMSDLLDREGAQWEKRARAAARPDFRLDNIMDRLDGGIAVLRDGGAVGASLRRWQQLLASLPHYDKLAREIGKYLRRAG